MNATVAVARSRPLPWPVWPVLALLVVSLLSVAWWRTTQSGDGVRPAPAGPQRALFFSDSPEGDVLVRDARSDAEVARFQGEQGFLRGALRALVRERKRRDIDDRVPFELIRSPQTGLTLYDPTTGQRIALESFGPTNAAVFARLASTTDAAPAASAR